MHRLIFTESEGDKQVLSFSYNHITQDYAARVMDAIERNKGYIVTFNKGNVNEAKQRIFAAALKEEKRAYTNLDPYIKVLSRHVMKARSKDIPYAPYNEDGEVALVFTSLTDTPKFDKFDDKAQIVGALEELYLRFPEDFTQIGALIPSVQRGDVFPVIKNDELKEAVFNLMRSFDSALVLHSIVEFLTNMAKEKAKLVNERAGIVKEVQLQPTIPVATVKATLGDRKWVLDESGTPVGVLPTTLKMENDFNPEWHQLRLAVSTVCPIYALDISKYLNSIEEKVYVEQGVDNEYIVWCGSKYRLTTPAGTAVIGRDRGVYMDLVRRELITSLVVSGVGTVIAAGPDTVYLKLTRASNITNLVFKTDKRSFICPLTAQQVVPCKV